jgi:hypothetical protein
MPYYRPNHILNKINCIADWNYSYIIFFFYADKVCVNDHNYVKKIRSDNMSTLTLNIYRDRKVD